MVSYCLESQRHLNNFNKHAVKSLLFTSIVKLKGLPNKWGTPDIRRPMKYICWQPSRQFSQKQNGEVQSGLIQFDLFIIHSTKMGKYIVDSYNVSDDLFIIHPTQAKLCILQDSVAYRWKIIDIALRFHISEMAGGN